ANLHWGGADWGTLFVCACTSVYEIQTKTRGSTEPFMSSKALVQHRSEPMPASVKSPELITVPIRDRIIGSRTALILQDLQNDVIMDGGAFAASGSPDHARTQNVLANAA